MVIGLFLLQLNWFTNLINEYYEKVYHFFYTCIRNKSNSHTVTGLFYAHVSVATNILQLKLLYTHGHQGIYNNNSCNIDVGSFFPF